jgi:hypothetical protein
MTYAQIDLGVWDRSIGLPEPGVPTQGYEARPLILPPAANVTIIVRGFFGPGRFVEFFDAKLNEEW